MRRLPYQVLVILYLRDENGLRYCVFERESPVNQIQFVAGGGENDETPLEAAKREVFEESGIVDAQFQQLVSICYIPTNIFSDAQRKAWGKDVIVVPEHSFGAETKSDVIKISNEHKSYRWVSYDEALTLLKWDSNKTALFELNSKLTFYQEVLQHG